VELTKQQRVMVAVLAVAGCALAVDRVILGTGASGPSNAAAQISGQFSGQISDQAASQAAPQPASDAAAAALPGPVADAAQPGKEPALPPVQRESIARQLASLELAAPGAPQTAEGLDDAFWDVSRPLEVIEIAPEPEQPAPTQAPQVPEHISRHTLTAILNTPAGPIAVVDGRALKVGRPSGGLTLRGVEGRSTAIVEVAGREIRLELRRDAQPSRPARDKSEGATRDVR
jgi:hypothetical protein